MLRNRLSKSPVGALLTLTADIGIYDCENFILEGAIERHHFSHWVDHVVPLHAKLTNDYLLKAYKSGDEFARLKKVVVENLIIAGFKRQGAELEAASSEDLFNSLMFRQYTEETEIYPAVNQLLRLGHAGRDVSDSPLVPWICQLAAALRTVPEFLSVSYRGTTMRAEDIEKYKVKEIFVWAPFTSASKHINSCLGGNVIFEFVPVSALSERDKRAPRDISKYSVFPSEDEVLLPMCCAYRPIKIEDRSGVRFIRTEILDHY